MVIFQCSVEPRNNEPPEVLGITNDFLCPSNSKIYEKEPRHNKARYSKHYIKFHCKRERFKPLTKYRRKISVDLINPL